MDAVTERWLASLERRHLANLTVSEVARALRALSSCYVERRSKLADGGALASAGKRAAFALFYGPVHFFLTAEITRALPGATEGLSELVDLGCGTGAAGAAWAMAASVRRITGIDKHPWALAEAASTYRAFNLDGRTGRRDIGGAAQQTFRTGPGIGVLAAFAANELTNEGRAVLLAGLLAARDRGSRVLIIEPIARRALPWWEHWTRACLDAGGRTDEWRFPAGLPPTQRTLAKAAGLDPRELTGRSLLL